MTVVFSQVDDRFVNPLFEVFDGGDFVLSSYRDVEDALTTMQIFFPDEADAPKAIEALVNAGRIVGVDLKPSVRTFPDEDWKLSYRKHFKTDVISDALAVVPEWEVESFKPQEGQKVLILDPGLAFGTGRHGTTRACLEFIAAEAAADPRRTFLDVGAGSGILAIAAALLGFNGVRAFDNDPEAVESAVENARRNGVDIGMRLGDLVKPEPPAQVVAANVLGPVLIRFADEISAMVVKGPGSRLILSGILTELYPEVKAAYEAIGFEEIATREIGEWKSGLFRPAL